MKLLDTWKPARKPILYFALSIYALEQCWAFSSVFPYSANVEETVKLFYVAAIALVFLLQDFTPEMYLAYGLLAIACLLTRIGTGQMFLVYTVITILALRQEENISDILHILRLCLTAFLIVSTIVFFYKYFRGERQL